MSDSETLHGLSCPRCGGTILIPEGQPLVICPFCDLRSVVKGERGVLRYQIPCKIDHAQAVKAYQGFFHGKMGIGWGTASKARLNEVILTHLPFWTVWGSGMGWVFGEKKKGGDDDRYEPREVRVVEEMVWTEAACDVGEFGVSRIDLRNRPLEPFNPDDLHRSGMVFEAVGSEKQALEKAHRDFHKRVHDKAGLERVSQTFVRVLRPRLGLVFYPLWVMRYSVGNRSFQVVIDGFSGEVLYGKAPGNSFYRAAVLVGGMGFGSFLGISLPTTILTSMDSDSDDVGTFLLVMFAAGIGMMYMGYRSFRFGEHYEYRRFKEESGDDAAFLNIGSAGKEAVKLLKDLGDWK